VTKVTQLKKINYAHRASDPAMIWLQQGSHFRKVDVKKMELVREFTLSETPQQVILHEPNEHCVYTLSDKRHLHANGKFVASAPFEIKRPEILFYYEAFVVIAEKNKKLHLCELNEFYNLVNHHEIELGSLVRSKNGYNVYNLALTAFDETVFCITTHGILKTAVYKELRSDDETIRFDEPASSADIHDTYAVVQMDNDIKLIDLIQFATIRTFVVDRPLDDVKFLTFNLGSQSNLLELLAAANDKLIRISCCHSDLLAESKEPMKITTVELPVKAGRKFVPFVNHRKLVVVDHFYLSIVRY